MTWTIKDSDEIYRISRWSDGYYQIGQNGHLYMNASASKQNVDDDPGIDIHAVIEEAKAQQIQFPMVLRFHDILRSQVVAINEVFNKVIDEYGYQGRYKGVFPIKVNQMREVVEEIVDAGKPYDYGLEAGSKAELMSVLAYNSNRDSLTVLNGYKDEDYIRLALLGIRLKRNIIFVVEKFSELEMLVGIAKEQGIEPKIGLRMRMMVKGRGKWQSSSGIRAKFGLSITEILNAVDLLEHHGLKHCITMLHFHIGSQLTDIRAIKEAVNEASRIYAKLYQEGIPIHYIDVGGGLGVDYDGSQSTSDSSKNYSIEEYVADIVDGFQQTCDLESVPHPDIVSESGRAITAHHSCVITPIIGEINPSTVSRNFSHMSSNNVTTVNQAVKAAHPGIPVNQNNPVNQGNLEQKEHILLANMRSLLSILDEKNNPQETYNDVSQIKEESLHAFKLGLLSLQEMAELETLYWQVMGKIQQYSKQESFFSEQLEEVNGLLSSQYLCNFSVFQSAADSWAIEQVLPVVPIHRLQQEPTKNCSLVDITCDSDGKIERFIGESGSESTLPLHSLNQGEDYYIGVFLTGAYQDVMGDMHNLFGRVNEVHVFQSQSEPEGFYIEEVVYGSKAKDVLNTMQYNSNSMERRIKKLVDKEVAAGNIGPREGVALVDFYEACLDSYTYLT